MNITSLGNSIKYNRELMNLTQDRLSEMLNVSTHYIYELEHGLKVPSLPMLISIAECFHTTTDALLSDIPHTPLEADKLDTLLSNLTKESRNKLYYIISAIIPYLDIK